MWNIYTYINLSYMIVNLVCIFFSHHCVICFIPNVFMNSIITMYDLEVNVTVNTFMPLI